MYSLSHIWCKIPNLKCYLPPNLCVSVFTVFDLPRLRSLLLPPSLSIETSRKPFVQPSCVGWFDRAHGICLFCSAPFKAKLVCWGKSFEKLRMICRAKEQRSSIECCTADGDLLWANMYDCLEIRIFIVLIFVKKVWFGDWGWVCNCCVSYGWIWCPIVKKKVPAKHLPYWMFRCWRFQTARNHTNNAARSR